MKLATQFCFDGITPEDTGLFSDEYLDADIWNTIINIAPAFNETFVFCKLFGKIIDCEKLFYPQITERGLCYTFNTFNVHEMFTNE